MSNTETKLAWSRGTAPAWQVREMARQKLLEEIQRDLMDKEEGLQNYLDFHQIALHLIVGKLRDGSLSMSFSDSLPHFPRDLRQTTFDVLKTAAAKIALFKRSPEEGNAMWAKMLEWSASQLAQPFASALRQQEVLEPQRVYGVPSAMDEVPIPD